MYQLFSFLKYVLKTIRDVFCAFPKWVKGCFRSAKDYWKEMRYKLRSLRQTNMDLGKVHLQKGNLFDAVLRFTLVDRWFAPGDSEARYYKAWSLYMQSKYVRARKFFQAAGDYEDAKEISSFLIDVRAGKRKDIPDSMWLRHQDLSISIIEEENLIMFAIPNILSTMIEQLDELPENCAILEIGSNIGVVAQNIQQKFSGQVSIDVLERAKLRQEFAVKYPYQNQFLYRDVYAQLPMDASRKPIKYDVILSLFAAATQTSNVDFLKKIPRHIKPGGSFIFLQRIGDTSDIDLRNLQILPTLEEIKADFKLAKLQITSINIETIGGVKCALIICVK